MSELEFRFVAHSDIGAILALFNKAYGGRVMSEAYYHWQFLDTPVFPASSVVAELDGRIVVHVGYTARQARLGDHDGILFIKQTSMSDPAVQGTGIYSRLLTWAHSALTKRGGELVLSYPNANNHFIQILRSDYLDIYQIPALVRDSQGRKQIRNEYHSKLIPMEFSDDYIDLARETLSESDFSLLRTGEYLRWRYGMRPDVMYNLLEDRSGGRLQSAIIWKYYPAETPKKIMVVDWLSLPDDPHGADIFEKIENIADERGLSVYVWQNIYEKFRHKLLEKRGYRAGEPVIYFGVFPLLRTQQVERLEDFRCWHVSMSDVDIF